MPADNFALVCMVGFSQITQITQIAQIVAECSGQLLKRGGGIYLGRQWVLIRLGNI